MNDRGRVLRQQLKSAAAALLFCGAAMAQTREVRAVGDRLGLPAGASVALHGAGAADLVGPITKAIGARGRLFIIESDRAVAQNLRRSIETAGQSNATVIIPATADWQLPHTVDALILYNSYHDLDKRSSFFAGSRKFLRANARLIIVDYYRRPMQVGPPLGERVASSQVMEEMERYGFRLLRRYNVLPYQYFLIYGLRKR